MANYIDAKPPVYYDTINLYNASVSPSTVHSKNTSLTRYFQRYLLQKVISVFEFEGIPETWNYDYFINTLLIMGYIAVVETDKYGVIPQHCSLYGRDVFYQPSNVVVSNPLIRGILQPRIGEECALIKLQSDYCGVWDKICYYADMLALTSESIATNLVNSKLAFVFASDSKNAAESFKKMYDEVTAGNPAVFVDKALFKEDGEPAWLTFSQNLEQNYISNELLADLHRIINLFNTEIGIPNANFEKSERLITDEVNANNEDTRSQAVVWLESIKKGLDDVRELFGIDIQAHLRYNYKPQESAEPDESDDANYYDDYDDEEGDE